MCDCLVVISNPSDVFAWKMSHAERKEPNVRHFACSSTCQILRLTFVAYRSRMKQVIPRRKRGGGPWYTYVVIDWSLYSLLSRANSSPEKNKRENRRKVSNFILRNPNSEYLHLIGVIRKLCGTRNDPPHERDRREEFVKGKSPSITLRAMQTHAQKTQLKFLHF